MSKPSHPDLEVVREPPLGHLRYALFDFDGTISLIRTGWQDVMLPMMIDELAACPAAEDRETIAHVVREFVDTLTGKQTIYQMIRLAEEVTKRGGTPAEPLVYKHRYLDLLWAQVGHRVHGLRAGSIAPDDLLVPGVRGLLEGLVARGITCYLASGTDEPYVISEAEALRVTPYFEDRIFGALDAYQNFSKAQIIARMLSEHGLSGPELVAFGDGYVEIENTIEVGGIAVGAATDEANKAGVDAWKRNRLIGAGAHLIVPDFRCHDALLDYLLGEA